jgi:cobalt/nickel transport system permease protein
MNHSFIDEHSHIDSLLSRLDPRVKIVSFLVFLIFVALAEPGCSLCFALYALLIAVLSGISRIPFLYIAKRSLVVLPFILLTSVFALLAKPGNPVYQLQMGPLSFSVSAAGWILFQSVIIKGMLCVLCLILLTASTPFPQLLAALESMKVPSLITMILSFMYRYIFLIEDEAMKMWRAMKSRSTGGSKRLQLKALTNMIGILFIRSFERGETVYLAMCSRGFDGTMQRRYSFSVKKHDWAFLINIIAVLISIKLLDNYLGG